MIRRFQKALCRSKRADISHTALYPHPKPDLLPYHHQPLDHTRAQIRLVKLTSLSVASESVHCVIDVFNLADAPPFSALSYMWGPAAPIYPILIDGKQLTIRGNLFYFLNEYRRLDGSDGYLWIDQICIDQLNILERNHQVQFMSYIYSTSQCVIVWLGDGSETHDGETYYVYAQRFNRASRVDGHAAAENLGALLHNDYFRRLWIVQEVLLASKIRVLVKDIWISWEDMVQVPNLTRGGWLVEAPKRWSATLLLRHSLRKEQSRTLADLVRAFGNNLCEDARDKVYGFMSLVAPQNRIVVDYGKSVHQVFLDLALVTCTACLDSSSWRNSSDFSNYKNRWLDEWDILSEFAFNIGLSLFEIDSLSHFYSNIWQKEKLGRSAGLPFPITAMGFEPGLTSETLDRWWYEFQGKRYYFNCEPKILDPKTNPALFEDWAVYIPMDQKRHELVTTAEGEPAQYHDSTTDPAILTHVLSLKSI
jgi:hypothetical protein